MSLSRDAAQCTINIQRSFFVNLTALLSACCYLYLLRISSFSKSTHHLVASLIHLLSVCVWLVQMLWSDFAWAFTLIIILVHFDDASKNADVISFCGSELRSANWQTSNWYWKNWTYLPNLLLSYILIIIFLFFLSFAVSHFILFA